MHYTDIAHLLQNINKTESTQYLELIEHINTNKLEGSSIVDYLEKTLTTSNTLNDAHKQLFKSMRFKGGHYIWFSTYGKNISNLSKDMSNIHRNYSFLDTLKDVSADDLKYLSTYHQSQWKKLNASKNSKGSHFTFNMDEFSLGIFRGSITKPYSRTEAKTIALRVNSGFDSSAKDLKATSIRNRFYKLILDNTEYHTKALINTLQKTELINNDATFYNVREDETICLQINGWKYRELQAYSSPASQEEYSSDTAIATSSKAEHDIRGVESVQTAASIFTTLYVKTGNEANLVQANRMLAQIKNVDALYNSTKSAALLHRLVSDIKENNEQDSN